MSIMFAKLSKFRSQASSRNGSGRLSQEGDNQFGHNEIEYSRYSFSSGTPYPTESSPPPAAPLVHLVPLPLGKNTMPIPSVAPLTETYTSDTDDNVSFAECLFPITPPGEVVFGRRLSNEGLGGDDLLNSPSADFSLGPSIGLEKAPLVYGRRSVDTAMVKKTWLSKHVDHGRRSVDVTMMKKSWSEKDETRKTWESQDIEGFSDSSINRLSSFEYNRKDVTYDSRRAIWEASHKQVWVPERRWGSDQEGIDSVLLPLEDAEEEFLEDFEEYFNNVRVDNVRRIQYPKLELQKIVYLDYANFSLFSNAQVEEHLKILLAHGPCLGSASFSSSSANPLFKHVADTQKRLLRMLNTTPNHYSIIFTAGFQESFRLVAESYPFQKGTPLLVCQDNHAVVRQVVQSAQRAGGKPTLFPVTEEELCFHSHALHKHLRQHSGRHSTGGHGHGGLFVYPAQSNLSGMKHSLGWVVEAQQSGWNVCLDVSTFLPTGALELDIHQPDLVVGSFHHMVGYPSGMGFLLVRRESFCVQASPSGERLQFLRNKPADEGEQCHIMCPADNTMNLLQFAALNLGLIQLERIGVAAIQKRVRSLTQWLVQRLHSLKPLLRIYGSLAAKDRGSIVSFNVVDPSGTMLPPDIVRNLAARCNIQLSVGNFHNPGLSNLLEADSLVIKDCSVFQGVSGFTAVRASFGAVSNFADVYRLVQFLTRFRDEEYLSSEAIGFVEERYFHQSSQ